MERPNLEGKDLLAAAKSQQLHNKVQMPVLGLGTWRLRGEKLQSGVWGALHEGYGLIDTAAVYGNEEEIRDLLKDAGNPKVFITSKLQPRDANGVEAVLRAFDATIKRLNVKQLDLYLIHWPGKRIHPTPLNRGLRSESWRALEQLYEQKKVRAIGVSNFMISHIEELLADGATVVPMLEWHPMCWIPEMIPFAEKHNIILQAYSSLGSGENRLLEHPVVKQIAREINQPPAVVLLRWPLQQGLMMTFWRSCCGSFWGGAPSELHTHRSKSSRPKSSVSACTETWQEEEVQAVDQAEKADFQPHSEASADILAKKWITHVQKRAAKVWEREQVLNLLRTVAQSVSFSDDPILGDPAPSAPCVQWHGDLSMEQGLPVIYVPKTGYEGMVPSYISKLLAFLFADDHSLKMLKQVGTGSGSMNCGNSQCIRLSHFVGYTTDWAAKYQPKTKAGPKAKAGKAAAKAKA
ncbi:hypothetical protein Esti_004379 [Eimeria stiedai]